MMTTSHNKENLEVASEEEEAVSKVKEDNTTMNHMPEVMKMTTTEDLKAEATIMMTSIDHKEIKTDHSEVEDQRVNLVRDLMVVKEHMVIDHLVEIEVSVATDLSEVEVALKEEILVVIEHSVVIDHSAVIDHSEEEVHQEVISVVTVVNSVVQEKNSVEVAVALVVTDHLEAEADSKVDLAVIDHIEEEVHQEEDTMRTLDHNKNSMNEHWKQDLVSFVLMSNMHSRN